MAGGLGCEVVGALQCTILIWLGIVLIQSQNGKALVGAARVGLRPGLSALQHHFTCGEDGIVAQTRARIIQDSL